MVVVVVVTLSGYFMLGEDVEEMLIVGSYRGYGIAAYSWHKEDLQVFER